MPREKTSFTKMLPATEPSNPPPDPERDLEGSFVPLLHGSIICHQVIPDNVWTQLQHKNGWKTPGMGTSFKSQHWRGNRGHPGQSIQSQQGCKSLITHRVRSPFLNRKNTWLQPVEVRGSSFKWQQTECAEGRWHFVMADCFMLFESWLVFHLIVLWLSFQRLADVTPRKI